METKRKYIVMYSKKFYQKKFQVEMQLLNSYFFLSKLSIDLLISYVMMIVFRTMHKLLSRVGTDIKERNKQKRNRNRNRNKI